jgi:hypothetical protein
MNTTSPVEIFATDNGTTEIQVRLQQDTVWLTQKQMGELFDRDYKTISKHIINVLKEGELERNSVVANFATVQIEGGREVGLCPNMRKPKESCRLRLYLGKETTKGSGSPPGSRTTGIVKSSETSSTPRL